MNVKLRGSAFLGGVALISRPNKRTSPPKAGTPADALGDHQNPAEGAQCGAWLAFDGAFPVA